MKRLFTCLLAAAILFSFAACAGDSSSTGTAAGTPGTTNADGKYDPAIVIRLGTVEIDPTDEPIDGQTASDNLWIDAYRDELGIVFEDMFVVSSEQMEDKLNLQISSGQIPDLMSVTRKQFEMLVSSGLAEDLSAVYKEYASDKTKEYLNADGGICLKMSEVGGHLYALPGTQGYLESASVITWIRKDWLDNLNMDIPENFENLRKVMLAFTKDDPDKNGLDDTFAFTTSNTLDEFMGLFASFGSYPKSWIKNADGEIVYGGIQDEAKAALAFLKEMFDEGVVNREFGANDWNQYIKAIDSGKSGIIWQPWYAVDWPLGDSHNEAGAEWVPVKIFGANGGDINVMGVAEPHTYYVIRKGYENPEALVKMFNLWFEKAYGTREEIIKYHKNEKGEMPANYSEIRPWLAHEDIEYYLTIRDKLAGNDVGEMFPSCEMYYEGVSRYMESPNEDDYFTYKMYGPESACGILNYYIENKLVLQDEYYGAGTETMKSKWGVLETKQLETYVKIIMGEVPLDAFDDFVADWNASGGEKVSQEVRQWAAQKD